MELAHELDEILGDIYWSAPRESRISVSVHCRGRIIFLSQWTTEAESSISVSVDYSKGRVAFLSLWTTEGRVAFLSPWTAARDE